MVRVGSTPGWWTGMNWPGSKQATTTLSRSFSVTITRLKRCGVKAVVCWYEFNKIAIILSLSIMQGFN